MPYISGNAKFDVGQIVTLKLHNRKVEILSVILEFVAPSDQYVASIPLYRVRDYDFQVYSLTEHELEEVKDEVKTQFNTADVTNSPSTNDSF